jgi:hypothetical protein
MACPRPSKGGRIPLFRKHQPCARAIPTAYDRLGVDAGRNAMRQHPIPALRRALDAMQIDLQLAATPANSFQCGDDVPFFASFGGSTSTGSSVVPCSLP